MVRALDPRRVRHTEDLVRLRRSQIDFELVVLVRRLQLQNRIGLLPLVSFVVFVVSNRSRFGKKFVDFVVVGFERVAHD